jgi:uncharacterized protein (TIGR00369 family)
VTNTTEIAKFLSEEFPQARCIVEQAGNGRSRVRRLVGSEELRPGGTLSGAVIMAVADVALYTAVLGEAGMVPLAATTHLSVNFLRRCAPSGSVIGVCKLLKTGRSLIVGEVALYSEGSEDMIAHAVGTYSIPPANADSRRST